jgi:hypothetical protein
LKYQILTFNFANVALLIVIIIISINTNSTLSQQQTANVQAQRSLGELKVQLASASKTVDEITQGKDFFINRGYSNFSQLVAQYSNFNSTFQTLTGEKSIMEISIDVSCGNPCYFYNNPAWSFGTIVPFNTVSKATSQSSITLSATKGDIVLTNTGSLSKSF